MRLLRLAVDGDQVVDLHPRCSVVAGLGPERSAVLRRSADAVGVGLAPEVPGIVEAHGVLLGTDQADLDLLALALDPVPTVAVPATLDPDPSTVPEALRSAEQDVLELAAERHRAATAWRDVRTAPTATERDLARADQLRAAIEAHGSTAAEPLRVALDVVRDLGDAADGAARDGARRALVEQLAERGVDLRVHDAHRPLDLGEIRRVAEDWLDEHRARAAWVTGARVELDGIERRLRHAPPDAGAVPGGPLPESAERRAARLTAALASAIAQADARRSTPTAAPGVEELEAALLARLDHHRRDRPAGAAPLVLDRVLGGLADDELGPLLDRVADHAGAVQLVVLDDHPAARAWAREAGDRRAALVAPDPDPLR